MSDPATDHPAIVYTPDSALSDPVGLVTGILGDMIRHRGLVWILFLRDLKAQFRQSLLGYAWLVIPPLASALVWYLMNSTSLIRIETQVPYPIFVLIGTALWSAFAATLMAPSDAIYQNREVFVKLNVPVEAFILAAAGRAVFNLLVTSAILLPLLLWQGIAPGWGALLFPITAACFLLSAFALGMCLAPIGSLYADFRNAIGPLVALLMFTVPVVFPIPSEGGVLGIVIRNNPLTPALAASRDLLVAGQSSWLGATFVWAFASTCLLFVTFIGLRVAKPHIIARLGM